METGVGTSYSYGRRVVFEDQDRPDIFVRKKVLILTPFYKPNIGGAETFAEELVKVAGKDYWVTVLTYQPFNKIVSPVEWEHAVIRRMRWVVRPKEWKGTGFVKFFMVVPKMLIGALLLDFVWQYDTIHALGLNAAFVGALVKKVRKVRLIVTPLALYKFKQHRFLANVTRWVLKHADVVFTESEVSRRDLMDAGVDRKKIKIFNHWVDTDNFYSVKHKNKRLKVLFVGRPIREKGIEIVRQVQKQMKGVDFLYAENVPIAYMPELYQVADVLIVPSLYAESPNRVVAEGAFSGCVVVTSNNGALPEQVKGFGIAVKPTVRNFVLVIKGLDKDRKKLARMRLTTLRYAKKYFTEENAEKITDEY